MRGPRNTEPQANYVLARALRRRNPEWTDSTVHAERTRVIQLVSPEAGTAKRPDIVVAPPRYQAVIVETEFAPARTVETDAKARLGTELTSTGAEIEGTLSVVLPEHLRTGDLEAIENASFRFATHYLDGHDKKTRWPSAGNWLEGGVDDLADAIEFLSLSERRLTRGTEELEAVVRNAAGLLAGHAGDGPLARIASDLHQEAGEQTQRMAAAICVSAFMFHAAIEGQEGIPQVPLPGSISRDTLLETWNAILEVNYWPIFSIARDLVRRLPLRAVPPVMNRIARAIPRLDQLGATSYHDLTGRMFQTLISDRKFIASFYTLPASACLLAELAVERLNVDWSDRPAIERLRIADFACGTGALLSAAQRAVYRRYRRTGGNDEDLHRALMERVLFGLDIMPAATHLTCSMLSSTHPHLEYGRSQIHTMPYGTDGGSTHIGALDLLDADQSYSLFATGQVQFGGTESDRLLQHSVPLEAGSCDLVIMNPPFTRPTNHEAGHADIPVPSFAGFNTSHDEQRAMRRKLNRARGLFGNGNAGLASNFMDLGHLKLREGGVLAMVLPFSFAQGRSWRGAREALRAHYDDIHITSIATTGSTAQAFSADTGMAECLVVATKRHGGSPLTTFTNLDARPSLLLEAAERAKNAGHDAIRADIREAGAAGVRSRSVIETARELEAGLLRLPRHPEATPLPVVTLGTVAERGLVHRDINGGPPVGDDAGLARGPFVVRPIRPGEIPTYPMLWAHAAGRERRLVVQVDRCGDPREGDDVRAAERYNSNASRLHSNLDFRLNSQSLAMCLTPEPCLGGTAWPNILPTNERDEIPLLLWCNTTLGLLMYWWKGTRQQLGRARITITAILDLPVLDPRALSTGQRTSCHAIFERLRDENFLPANEAYRDDTRRRLDRAFLFGDTSVLGLNPNLSGGLDLLRDQWCAEPSVHGGKATRIEV